MNQGGAAEQNYENGKDVNQVNAGLLCQFRYRKQENVVLKFEPPVSIVVSEFSLIHGSETGRVKVEFVRSASPQNIHRYSAL